MCNYLVNHGCSLIWVLEKFLKKLAGRKDIEDALRRLDRLTQEEALMAAAQILNLAHTIDNKVMGVGSKLNAVDDKMDVVIEGMLDLSVTHSPYPNCAYAG